MGHWYPHPHHPELQLPSVTTILDATRPAAQQAVLDRWYAKPGSQAINLASRERGNQIDAWAKAYLQRLELPAVAGEYQIYCDRLLPLLDYILTNGKIRLLQRPVHDLGRGYAGEPDLIVELDHAPLVLDFKTKSKPMHPNSLYEAQLQCTGYAEAFESEYLELVTAVAVVEVTPKYLLTHHSHNLRLLSREWAKRLVQFGAYKYAIPTL
ncbi:MAG TPA: hypothetical protein V6C63_02050 [Allocoleopsis sp.]